MPLDVVASVVVVVGLDELGRLLPEERLLADVVGVVHVGGHVVVGRRLEVDGLRLFGLAVGDLLRVRPLLLGRHPLHRGHVLQVVGRIPRRPEPRSRVIWYELIKNVINMRVNY